MSHFITEADQDEIHAGWWAEGETVTIKRFTYVDNCKISQRSSVGGVTVDEDGNRRIKIDMGLWAESRLVIGIVAWTFTDENGKPIPCTSDRKCALNDRDGKFILAALNEFNEERSAEAQESF